MATASQRPYTYDDKTFRLKRLATTRTASTAPGCLAALAPSFLLRRLAGGDPSASALQNLTYTYDPVGNITYIHDDAQQTIYFRNRRVEPSAEYAYDAIYRLIEATGREHLGQVGGAPIPHSYKDVPRVGMLHPGDGSAMGTYVEQYLNRPT